MKLERNRAERRSKIGAQIVFAGIPFLIFAAISAGFLLGCPSAVATSAIAQAKKSTVTVMKRSRFLVFSAAYIGKTNSVMATTFTSSDFTYTGTYTWVDDGGGNWRLKFLTSGTFTPLKSVVIDEFLVGGGGGGGGTTDNDYTSGGGGGGGYAGTYSNITLNANQAYAITIGSGGAGASAKNVAGSTGGTTSGFGNSKTGGIGGAITGGNGGSGGGSSGYSSSYNAGNGGTDGGNGGSSNTRPGGTGQGTTTKEFGDSSGYVYSGGGGGGAHGTGGAAGTGGVNGGGNGSSGMNGTANTGGGGGGATGTYDGNRTGGTGGSGILIIRNKR